MSEAYDLDGRRFRPVSNSAEGRVARDAIFTFSQTGDAFTALYSGAGFMDGHLIGRMTSIETAALIYHCRSDDGSLEAGEAIAKLSEATDGSIVIDMDWRWLNGSMASGTSQYKEIPDE